MDRLFGCFTCRKKRKRRVSALHAPTPQSQVPKRHEFVSNTVPVKASSIQKPAVSPKDLYKVRQTPAGSSASTRHVNGEPFESSPASLRFRAPSNNATKYEVENKSRPATNNEVERKTVPAAFKADTTDFPLFKRFSDPRSQVDEIEEELENLRRKLAHEADEARKLRDEVRHLRTCGELLESPSAFKKALVNLRDNLRTGSAGEVESEQLTCPLLSVLAKIEPDGTLIEACSSRAISPFRYLSEGCSKTFPQSSKNGKEESTGSICSTNEINKVNMSTRGAEGQNPSSAEWHKLSSSSSGKRKTDSASWERLEIFETSEDLLLEPIDGSSLVTDSEIVTIWENSFGQRDSEGQVSLSETEQSSLEDTAQSLEVPEVAAAEVQDRRSAKLASPSQKILKETTAFRHCSGTTDNLVQIAGMEEEEFYTASESTEFLSCSSERTVLVEDDAGKKSISDQLDRRFMRCFYVRSNSGKPSRSTSSVARVVEETEMSSSSEIEEPSKSLFAFSPCTSSQGQSLSFGSTSDGLAPSASDISSNTDSEESHPENTSSSACVLERMKRNLETVSQGCCSPQYRPSRPTWNRNGKCVSDTELSFSSSVEELRIDFHTQNLQPSHTSPKWTRRQVVGNSEGSSDHFLNELTHLSTECSGKRNADRVGTEGIAVEQRSHRSHASLRLVSLQPPAEDKTGTRDTTTQWNTMMEDEFPTEKVSKQAALQELSEQPLNVFDGVIHRHAATIRKLESENDHNNSASNCTSEESLSSTVCKATNLTMSGSETSLSEWLKPSLTLQPRPSHDGLPAPAGTSDEVTSMQGQNQSATELVSSPHIQSPLEQMHSSGSTKSSSGTEQTSSGITSASCPPTPETSDKSSSERDQTLSRTTSTSSTQAQTPPKWKQNQQFPRSSNEGTSKKEQSPSASTSTSSPLVRTSSNWMQGHLSPAKLADDRPILGTVAAHWSPVSTQKWWDGKGIPNSTNKYKEDQKVNWHATPFEVRLEQALAKQGHVLQKKLFGGAVSAEMELAAGLSSPQ